MRHLAARPDCGKLLAARYLCEKSVICNPWQPLYGPFFDSLTNNTKWAASTVCELYRARWEIEVFFNGLKGSDPSVYALLYMLDFGAADVVDCAAS